MAVSDSSAPGPAPAPSRHWPELDLLRALAGVCMISNHAGVSWLSENAWRHGLDGAITFVGSLAPILFFTVTGLGRGIQAAGRPPKPIADALRKTLVLFLADAALWLSPSQHFGLDFLAFIGLSALVLELLDRSRRPVPAIALALGACLTLRFGVAPRLGLPADGGIGVRALHLVLGDAGVPGVSYPLCPWLAYPLFGWLVGRYAVGRAERLRAERLRAAGGLAVLTLLGIGLCLLMLRRHMVFFRWGTLSFAFCLLGFTAIGAGIATVLAAVAALGSRSVAALALPGIASFVLVPIHYTLVGALQPSLQDPLARQPMLFPILLVIVVPLVFLICKSIDRQMRRISRGEPRPGLARWLLAAVVILLVVQLGTAASGARALLRLVVQLLATGLFVLWSPSRGTTPRAASRG
jgi:uncharacterized membrane protein